MRRSRKRIALAVVIVAASAFLFLDFRVSRSALRTGQQLTAVQCGEGMPATMRDQKHLTITVTGNGMLSGALRRRVIRDLRESGTLATVEEFADLVPDTKKPYLAVRLRDRSGFWTPFYARTRMVVEANFASNGDVEQLTGDRGVDCGDTNRSSLFTKATYTFEDGSWGLMSLSGYRSFLADSAAKAICEATLKAYEGKK